VLPPPSPSLTIFSLKGASTYDYFMSSRLLQLKEQHGQKVSGSPSVSEMPYGDFTHKGVSSSITNYMNSARFCIPPPPPPPFFFFLFFVVGHTFNRLCLFFVLCAFSKSSSSSLSQKMRISESEVNDDKTLCSFFILRSTTTSIPLIYSCKCNYSMVKLG
jgi:hypothetical protein